MLASLGILAAIGALVWFAASVLWKSEAVRWLLGLVFVVGGSMVVLGTMYQPLDGEVVAIKRTADNGSRLILAPIVVAYEDATGTRREAETLVHCESTAFRTLRPGDPVSLLVCRSNPDIVRISGQPWLGREKCEVPEI